MRDITRREEWRDEVEKGKMFGAMLARDEKGETVLLKAYSGQVLGQGDWEGYVPAVFDYLQEDGYFKRHEAEIVEISKEIDRCSASAELQMAREALYEAEKQKPTLPPSRPMPEDEEEKAAYLEKKLITKENEYTTPVICAAVEDSYDRLIAPAIEREIRNDLTEKAEDGAINVFGKNLEQLLLQPPIAGKVVLGWDPAFRTGCKLAVVDATGKVLDTKVIFPTAPQNKVEESKAELKKLIKKYNVDLISVGTRMSLPARSFVGSPFASVADASVAVEADASSTVATTSVLASVRTSLVAAVLPQPLKIDRPIVRARARDKYFFFIMISSFQVI